jgi:hypothetical protein
MESGFVLNCGGNGKLRRPLLVLLGLCLSTLPAGAALYSGGGTAGDPFIIDTPAKMNDIGLNPGDWGGYFKLTADIDLGGYTGEQFNIIGTYEDRFTGVFDGNGHTISNFTYSSAEKEYLALFGYVNGESAEIKSLGLINPNIDAGTGAVVGALIGWLKHGNVSDCYVEGGSVSGDNFIGGLVGMHHGSGASGSISDCYTTCSVSGRVHIGGLLAANGGISPTSVVVCRCYATGNVSASTDRPGGLVGENNGMISDSYATGNVVAGDDYAGGLVGVNGSFVPYASIISNCSASGEVAGDATVGGLVGVNQGTISKSCASGDVSGNGRLGGLVGTNWAGDFGGSYGDANGIITESYATGSVVGGYPIGGLVGRNYAGVISNCYAMGSVSGPDAWNIAGLVGLNEGGGAILDCYSTGHVSEGFIENGIGGLVGGNINGSSVVDCFWDTETSGHEDSNGGIGKTTAEMQTQATFTDAGWDFLGESVNGTEDIWRLCVDGTDYPRFVWQKSLLADFVCPNGVDALDLAFFQERWLANDCNGLNGYCDGADLNRSGEVDAVDYGLFAGYWSGELTALVLDEDFETGDFSKYDWQHSGAANWVVVSDVKYEGSYCSRSGAISHSEQTVLEVSVNTGIGSVSFYCKVSSEADEDYLRFYIDDELQDGWSGEQDWSLQEYVITSGPHTLKWLYEKDSSVSSGSDCGWIDKIVITDVMP